MNMEMIEDAEIILTTYGEVNRSYPKANVPENLVTAKQKVGNIPSSLVECRLTFSPGRLVERLLRGEQGHPASPQVPESRP